MHSESAGHPHGYWPDEMTISFDEADFELLALLYSRAAWRLAAAPDLPTSLIVPVDEAESPDAQGSSMPLEWEAAWSRRLSHLGDFDDYDYGADDLDDYFARWQAIQATLPPAWRDGFSPLFDEAYGDWLEDVRHEVRMRVRRRIQPSLVAAWRSGLAHFTVLPLVEPLAQRLTRGRAMVSIGGWNDDEFITAILEEWATGEAEAQEPTSGG